MGSKDVVFDVVGTLVSHDHLFDALGAKLGDRLRPHGIQPQLLGQCWLETAEREYAYISLAGRYVPFFDVMEALFYRTLMFAGIEKPREFVGEEEVRALVGEWKKLELRLGAVECIAKLRDAGFTVWCFSTADVARLQGYFTKGGLKIPNENILSCDDIGVAKPKPEAYEHILQKFDGGSKPWFAAAHMWDASGAAAAGFRGAYATVLEGEALPQIFGELEVTATSLPEMADKIIAAV